MKSYILIFIGLCVLGFSSISASAQWNPSQDAVWNIIENRIDRRRNAKKGSKAPAKQGKSTASRTGTKTPVKALHHNNVEFHRDTWQDFHLNDGYIVNFVFTPIKAAQSQPIIKSFTYNMINGAAYYDDFKEGSYKVSAEAVYNGKKYRVYLATTPAEFENQKGGNFAPSANLTIKQYVDQYGTRVIGGAPDTIYIRVIE